MARMSDLDKTSYAELEKMQADIGRMKIEKQDAERSTIRQKLIDAAKAAGFEIRG